jgi:hypothetical protein
MRHPLMNAEPTFHLKVVAVALAISIAIIALALAANEHDQSLAIADHPCSKQLEKYDE